MTEQAEIATRSFCPQASVPGCLKEGVYLQKPSTRTDCEDQTATSHLTAVSHDTKRGDFKVTSAVTRNSHHPLYTVPILLGSRCRHLPFTGFLIQRLSRNSTAYKVKFSLSSSSQHHHNFLKSYPITHHVPTVWPRSDGGSCGHEAQVLSSWD